MEDEINKLLQAAEEHRTESERILRQADDNHRRAVQRVQSLAASPDLCGVWDAHRNPFSDASHDYKPEGPTAGASSRETVGEVDTLANALQHLADVITRQNTLPKKEPAVFKGDIFDYPSWKNSFVVLVENRYPDFTDRLYYLGRYTGDDAKECIKGLLAVNTEEAYVRACDLLDERYGDKMKLARAFRDKIDKLGDVKPGDARALEKLYDFLAQCETAVGSLGQLRILDDPQEYSKILVKLPKYIQSRWHVEVDRWIYGCDSIAAARVHGDHPPFSVFCSFVKRQARIACNAQVVTGTSPVANNKNSSSKSTSGSSAQGRGNKTKVFQTTSTEASTAEAQPVVKTMNTNVSKVASKSKCPLCKESHELENCSSFQGLSVSERVDFVKKQGRCLGCLKYGHLKRDCHRKKQCEVCKRWHPTLLHDYSYVSTSQPRGAADVAKTFCVEVAQGDVVTTTQIVPVEMYHVDRPWQCSTVYALLDEQSDACFISTAVLEKIGVRGTDTKLKVGTVLSEETISCTKVKGLVVKGLNEMHRVILPDVFSRDTIPAKRSQIPDPELVKDWAHLAPIASKLSPLIDGAEIGLLIGINCSKAIRPLEVILGGEEEPYGVRTALGWGIVGTLSRTNANCSTALARHVSLRTTTKEILPEMVSRMFEVEFSERPAHDDEKFSQDDRRFLDIVTGGIQMREGHFHVPLPLRDEVHLPDNRPMVLKRLERLKTKLAKDQKYHSHYLEFMNDLIQQGHAERVPDDQLKRDDGAIWFIPHHGIYHPHKPDQIRVVFDCSAEYQGESLNKHLLQGPNMTNSLAGILCRFRKKPVAVTCDIQRMFYQVRVQEEFRDYLRFLWWPEGKLDSPPVEYRMCVFLFGSTSSPAVANFALKSTAEMFADQCDAQTAEFVQDSFYVDDGITSVDADEEAIQLIEDSRNLCDKGGFRLHKFMSNRKDVLAAIPESERAKSTQSIDILQDQLPTERTLGMLWNAELDSFQFAYSQREKPTTRRGILSIVSAIYDPLGLISPFVLTGKRILQDLCAEGVTWDDPVPWETKCRWDKWKLELPELAGLGVSRCYVSGDFGQMKTAQLHSFSDASLGGFGACSYLRLVDENDRIETALVAAKSRVTPTKPLTVPRLELTAAVTAVNLSKFLDTELKLDNLEHFYYTDSRVVLGYICNEAKRFHIYVANRTQKIREHTSPDQWRHIETSWNPADLTSRGMTVSEMMSCSLWWKGPPFLSELELPPPVGHVEPEADDPEVKRISHKISAKEVSSFTTRFAKFSSWFKLQRAVAVLQKCSARMKVSDVGVDLPVTVENLNRATMKILRLIQLETFPKEIEALQDRRDVSSRSNIYPLDPFLDDNGILRVGGRLRRSPLSYEVKHPILLPRDNPVSNLIMEHYHRKEGHPGRNMTLNSFRKAGYWIIGARTAATRLIKRCIPCKRLRGNPCTQKMSDLPIDRLDSVEPFSYNGCDVFGTFYVKQGRKTDVKRWAVIFTDLASRAIHIETINSLDTDSFLNAYRRFVCRRGPARLLRCDQGSNFIGGRNEMAAALKEMNTDRIREELLKDGCDFINFEFNVPKASHMAGVWERMILSSRRALDGLLMNVGSQLDDELFRTLMAEVENIVNSRPLTYDDAHSPDDPLPISPQQILTLKSNLTLPPPGAFVKEDLYCHRRWRRVQYLANQFWSRWRSEFLSLLQERKKWNKEHRNLAVDDVVLIIDENLPRNNWSLGRVRETHPSNDGLIRKVTLQTGKGHGVLERPIHKLILLVASNKGEENSGEDRAIPAGEPSEG